MRLALFDYYSSTIAFKDPTQIALGLKDIGVDVLYVARNPVSGRDVADAPFPVVTGGIVDSKEFWSGLSLDAVLLVSRLDPECTAIIKAIKLAGLRVLVKADSDGTLGYPLAPNYLRTLCWRREPIRTFFRNAKWRAPIRRYVGEKLSQIALADAVLIESPGARDNVCTILRHWGEPHLIPRLYFLPNPVAQDVLAIGTESIKKEKVVIAAGRWEESGAKNTQAMAEAICLFLRLRTDYRAIIVGSGQHLVESYFSRVECSIRDRLEITGPIDHGRLAAMFVRGQIFFMPSRMESFGIAAAEALCLGCSIAVTPVESLQYLAGDGYSGTIAAGFDARSAMRAIRNESLLWDAGGRSAQSISALWRTRLDRQVIAKAILDIINNLPAVVE